MGGEPFRNQDAVQDDFALDEGVEDFSWAHTRVEVVFAWLDPSFGILDLAEEPKPERADDESLLRKQTGEPLVFNVQIRQTWSGGEVGLSLLEQLREVPLLSLENSPVGDSALAHIAKLGRSSYGLSKLYLGSSRITGTGLPQLAPLRSLQYLSLKQLPIDDDRLGRRAGVRRLAGEHLVQYCT